MSQDADKGEGEENGEPPKGDEEEPQAETEPIMDHKHVDDEEAKEKKRAEAIFNVLKPGDAVVATPVLPAGPDALSIGPSLSNADTSRHYGFGAPAKEYKLHGKGTFQDMSYVSKNTVTYKPGNSYF